MRRYASKSKKAKLPLLRGGYQLITETRCPEIDILISNKRKSAQLHNLSLNASSVINIGPLFKIPEERKLQMEKDAHVDEALQFSGSKYVNSFGRNKKSVDAANN